MTGVGQLLLSAQTATWAIVAISIGGVLIRPRDWPEAWWAAAGAVSLVLTSLLSVPEALAAVDKGTDVYLFLTGMMLLAELARREGLFDWLAQQALRHARGSAPRLFGLIYLVGVGVTVFLSNDATAVVLTPAVYAATRKAGVSPLPYLFICAFIANAASFVLPISNPANLVLFHDRMPALRDWLMAFSLPSLITIVSTFFLLRFSQRAELARSITPPDDRGTLSSTGRITAFAVISTGALLLLASIREWPLGLSTGTAGVLTTLLVCARKRESPVTVVRPISWSVLPLVAGLFVMVASVEKTGLLQRLTGFAAVSATTHPHLAPLLSGLAAGYGSNLINNLPMGLVVATISQGGHLDLAMRSALLVGVDLGPNLSVTGSLATILWLMALRRESIRLNAWQFLKLGSVVMTLPLLASLGVVCLMRFAHLT